MGDAVGAEAALGEAVGGGETFEVLLEKALDEYQAEHGSLGALGQETDAYVKCWRTPPHRS